MRKPDLHFLNAAKLNYEFSKFCGIIDLLVTEKFSFSIFLKILVKVRKGYSKLGTWWSTIFDFLNSFNSMAQY